jgi:hypothetical protein
MIKEWKVVAINGIKLSNNNYFKQFYRQMKKLL